MSIAKHQNRKMKDRLVSGSVWAVLGKILAAVTGLLINSILARLLAPSDMGQYFLIISFVTAAVFVVQFGAQQFAVRDIAAALVGEDRANASSSVIWSVLRFGLVNAVVVCGVLILTGLTAPVQDLLGIGDVAVVLSVLLLFGRSLNGLVVESFRGLHDIRNASMFNLAFANLLMLIGLSSYWLFQRKPSLEEVLLVTGIAACLSLAAAWAILKKNLVSRKEVSMTSMSRMVVTGFPLFVTSMSIFVFTQADLWVVGAMIGTDAAALYGAVVRLIQVIFIPLLITNAVLPPIVSELWTQKRLPQLERVMRGMGTVAGIPAIIVLTVFAIWSSEILRLVYGEFYATGSMALIIISIGYIINVLSGSAQILLAMTGHDRMAMIINVVFGILMVGSLLMVAPLYGINGVAVVTAATVALQATTTWFAARRVAGIYTHFGIGQLKPALTAMLRKGTPAPGD